MHSDVQPIAPAGALVARGRLRATFLFALIVVSILVLVWPVTRSMVDTWQHSSTYGHCYVVIPIAIWMAWRQSAALATVPLKPAWPGLLVIVVIGFVGLLAELASVAVVTQFAAIGLAVATAVTVFGLRWARQLAFPLAFLFFAVPFGEGLLPVLMEWTADITVWALRATGIPVYREGNYFVVPTGSWSIVEACGGVRFLIAAMMTGCIFAWLQYRTPIKRTVFVLLALAVALLANWMRAYVMVMLGHFSDNRVGTGADHVWWGWLIFGGAMFVLFLIGMRWTDKGGGAQLQLEVRARVVSKSRISTALAASVLLAAAWPVAAAWIGSRTDTRLIQVAAITPRGGWQVAETAGGDWTPHLVAPSAVDIQTFVRDGSAVGVYRGLYRGQTQGSELVNSMNQIADSESKRWRLIDSGTLTLRLNDEPTLIRTAVVKGGNRQFLIWHWYWLAGHATSSDVRVKVQLALQRLTGASDTAAWVAVYTPVGDDTSAGMQRLTSFVEAMSGPIDTALATTAAR